MGKGDVVFVCQCNAVTDREIAEAIDAGNVTVEDVGDETGAGTGCGTCVGSIEDMIDERCGACPRVALTIVA
jgi:bacterioferritin-associated ferredoxin